MSFSIRKSQSVKVSSASSAPPLYWNTDNSGNLYNTNSGDISGTTFISSNIFAKDSITIGPINSNHINFAAGLAVTTTTLGYCQYAVSYDGINYIKIQVPGSSLSANIKSIFYSPQQKIWGAAGQGGTPTSYFAYSTNGINWTNGMSSVADVSLNRGEAIIYSPVDNLWVGGGRRNGTVGTAISYTSDLSGTWTRAVDISNFNMPYVYGLSYSLRLRRYLALGDNTGTATLGYSNDGKNWIGLGETIFSGIGQSAFYSETQGIWIAVGSGTNTIAWSNNGISWSGLGTSIFSTSGNAVVYSYEKNIWVAVGSGTNTVAYSSNGINWTPVDPSLNILSGGGTGVSYSNQLHMFSAIGPNGSAYSYDGINWISTTNPVFIGSGSTFDVASYYDGNLEFSTDTSGYISNSSSIEISSNKLIFNSTNVGINTTSPGTILDVNSDRIRLRYPLTPNPSSGNAGDICWDDNFLYIKISPISLRKLPLI